jgi:hypothetical protein
MQNNTFYVIKIEFNILFIYQNMQYLIKKVWDTYDPICYCCGVVGGFHLSKEETIERGLRPKQIGLIVAKKNGGDRNIKNLRPVCYVCAGGIGNRTVDEFKKIVEIRDRIEHETASCPICTRDFGRDEHIIKDSMQNTDERSINECYHWFCVDCLYELHDIGYYLCPICRRDITPIIDRCSESNSESE